MKLQFLKSKWMVFFGLASSVFAMIYTMLLFFIGTRVSFIPIVFFTNSDYRNLFIAVTHTLSVISAVIYLSSFYNNRYNSVIFSFATFNNLLYSLGVVLVFRCYYINDVEALIFIMTINGILMSLFVYLLSVYKYDLIDPETSKSSLLNLWLKITSMSGLVIFILAVFTYYRYTTRFLESVLPIHLTSKLVDAISVFLYVIGDIFLVIAFILMFFNEIRLKSIIRKIRENNR